MRTLIDVTVNVEGMHCWPGAPEHLAFLRARHRHTFVIHARLWVAEHDREVEFFELAEQVRHACGALYPLTDTGARDMGTRSCEMIAADLVDFLTLHACGVFEDGLHGAWVFAE